MAGTKAGAAKAKQTNLKKYGPDFHAKVGAKSWSNPNRSRKVGFALVDPKTRSELGRKGGSKTKEQYATTPKPLDDSEWTTAEDVQALAEDIDSL